MKKNPAIFPYIIIGISFLLCSFFPPILKAQTTDNKGELKKDFWSHIYYGGGLGLQVGNITLIDVSPLVGIKVTPRISLGISPTYKYYSYKNYYSTSSDLRTNVYGGSLFARVLIIENLFAHAEYEMLQYNTKQPGYSDYLKKYNSLLVGGGYRQPISANASMYILVLWNLNDTPDSPYTNPIIRAGFNIGF